MTWMTPADALNVTLIVMGILGAAWVIDQAIEHIIKS